MGIDLNTKKSWHPSRRANQERVWIVEKKAFEEKMKLDQLSKEREEERQMQELRRRQEDQTGTKRTERLEWMYVTPASLTRTIQNSSDLEEYLLGKKRVDKTLTTGANAKKTRAADKISIPVQSGNGAPEGAAKRREDPMLAIEQQERNAVKPKKDKEAKKLEKDQRRRRKRERKLLKQRNSHSLSAVDHRLLHRQRSRSGEQYPKPDRYSRSRRSPSPGDRRSRSRSRSPARHRLVGHRGDYRAPG
ncbi:Pre-mRNA splicing factor-domain-containing protein [Mycena rebaudengoi]|nr:Pre-mRNA splicing factor-domain-containing protein [Mycena rebaudengoi]